MRTSHTDRTTLLFMQLHQLQLHQLCCSCNSHTDRTTLLCQLLFMELQLLSCSLLFELAHGYDPSRLLK